MQICIFEDTSYSNFEPMVFSRPVYDLFCGIDSLKEKIVRSYGNVKVSLHCRPYLTEIVQHYNPDYMVNKIEDSKCLFINGRLLAPENLSELLPLIPAEDKVFVNEETVIAAYLSGPNLLKKINYINDLFSITDFNGLPIKILDLKCANYLWDLISQNGDQITEEFNYLKNSSKENQLDKIEPSVHILNKHNVFIGNKVTIRPGTVLDASNGPIIISDEVFIYPNAVLEGPCFIGTSSKIKSGAVI